MSSAETRRAAARIVVSFDPTPGGEAALEAAIAFAAALDAEIAGLFVEDIGLVRMAALPFTRELGLTSAVLRPIETPDIERAFRLQAEQSRAWLAAAASAFNLRWSFDVVRGESVNAVFECIEGCSLVVVGATARSARPFAAGPPGRPARPWQGFRYLGTRPVVMLFDGSERAMRSLEAAHALAARAGTRLTLLVTAETAEDFDRRRQQARSWLMERGSAARFVWLKSRDVDTVVRAVGAEDAAALLWHEEVAPEDRRELRSLLSELGCPLILVS